MANSNNKLRGRAAGALGIVALASALWALFLVRAFADPYVIVPAVIGLAGVAYYIFTNIGEMGEQFTGRGSFYAVMTTVFGVLLVGIVVGANYISVKKPKQWDFTKDKVYSLSDQTTSLLKGLKEEVQIRAFFSPVEPEHRELEERVRQYQQYTDKLKVEFVDPNRDRKAVQEANITSASPRILVKAGAKESRAKDPSEEGLTNAIAEVTRGASKKIYFTKGHGEHAVGGATEAGLKLFTEGLKGEGFQVDEIQLSSFKEMPKDAQVVVLAGPVAPLLEGEVKLLKEWTDKGGKLVAMVDPGVQTGLEKMLADFGVAVGNDTVLDPDSQQPELAIAQSYADHAITKPRSSPFPLAVVLPLARSVSKEKTAPQGWTVTELAKTGASAWGETELKKDEAPKFDAGKDTPGPVPLAVAATKGSGDSESRVLVVGNSNFVANGFYRLGGNRDFALNALGWAAKDEAKIAIRPNKRTGNLLFLSAEQKKSMFLFALNVLPFALLAAGLLVWQTRKSR